MPTPVRRRSVSVSVSVCVCVAVCVCVCVWLCVCVAVCVACAAPSGCHPHSYGALVCRVVSFQDPRFTGPHNTSPSDSTTVPLHTVTLRVVPHEDGTPNAVGGRHSLMPHAVAAECVTCMGLD